MGKRIAVLVNELGKISIDSKLILSQGGDVLELAGGCVCCKVGNDLWDGVGDIIDRAKPDHVILETTGIAEPQAILEAMEDLPIALKSKLELAGVICVVDARQGLPQINSRFEAKSQVSCSDRFLLTKLDVAESAVVLELHKGLEQMRGDVERASFPVGEEVPLVSWVLEKKLQRSHERGLFHKHNHGQIMAASFSFAEPLLEEPLRDLFDLVAPSLLRAKGFVNICGSQRRFFIEFAGGEISALFGDDWGNDVPKTELVFIGDSLDEAAIRRQLWACQGKDSEIPF